MTRDPRLPDPSSVVRPCPACMAAGSLRGEYLPGCRTCAPARRPAPEAVLQRLIIAQLRARGIWCWRQNTGAARTARGRTIRFGIPGQADITGILPGGRRLEIECKSATGRLTPEQREFGERVTAAGGLWVVARTLDDALNAVLAAVRT